MRNQSALSYLCMRETTRGRGGGPTGADGLFFFLFFFTILNPAQHLPAVSWCVCPSGGRKKNICCIHIEVIYCS